MSNIEHDLINLEYSSAVLICNIYYLSTIFICNIYLQYLSFIVYTNPQYLSAPWRAIESVTHELPAILQHEAVLEMQIKNLDQESDIS